MALAVSPIPFFFLGNHPCLDFINTQIVLEGRPADLLNSFSDLIRWLAQAKLLAEDPKQIERQWGGETKGTQLMDHARAFRAVLREMVERIASGKRVSQESVEVINGQLQSRVGYPQVISRKGRFERVFRAESQDLRRLMGLLAETASDLLCTCDLALIKKCQNPTCVLFFYDTTKNHARHWCSMSLCGNRSKVAAHYRRHRRTKA
ncbi:MAG: ABATE domain-containing protein [Nitrospira sp.]|nr:ABATE domain-containing protein [Nitrospira sp.]